MLIIGVGWGLANSTYSDYGLRLHPGSLPAADYAGIVGSVMWAPTISITATFLLLLFPDGHLPGPRWRYVGYVSALGILVGTLSMLVTPGPMKDAGYPHFDNPLGISALGSLAGKTLIYAVLISCLALLYIGSVYAIESAVRTVSGQSGTLAVTISTLVVALAFQPLRARIQRGVDHRFYRARYDATRTLETFSAHMRDLVDLEALNDEVLEVVTGALHPSHATLWLRSTRTER